MIQTPHHRLGPANATELLIVAGIFVALVFAIIFVCGYVLAWEWTGLAKKSLWDWPDLLIVPAVLAIGRYLFSGAQNRAAQAAAERRTQDEALQAYPDRMGQLLIDKDLIGARTGGCQSAVASPFLHANGSGKPGRPAQARRHEVRLR